MCGLAGAAGNTSVKTRDAFLDLLLITQLRGKDSTGVFTVDNSDVVKHAKQLGTPDVLFDMKSFDKTMYGVPKVFAGHCRSKTVGDNTQSNAHPYDFDNLVGMHNGTLRGHSDLDGYDYKRTDSWALYQHIDRFGIEETMQKLDPDSAYALVWWDKVNLTLNFLRNDKRPLWFAWSKDKSCMYWCSEPWMFNAVARHVDLWDGKAEKEGEKDCSPYFSLPTDTLWSFTVKSYVKQGENHMTFHQPRTMKAEGQKKVGFFPGNSGMVTTSSRKGGEVTNPFPKDITKDDAEAAYARFVQRQGSATALNDDLEGIASGVPGASGTTKSSQEKSQTHSSNVLDFRPGTMRGRNSSSRTLSLPQKSSEDSQRNSNGKSSEPSNGCETKTRSTPDCHSFPQVSVRTVAGTSYISHKHTSTEISLEEFEGRTGGKCSFCHQPIGDLSEVAAFTDKALSGFICTSCLTQPNIALAG